MRSIGGTTSSDGSVAAWVGAPAGCSEGQEKLRSTRSCGPECRCTFLRTAAVGTLNSVPPTLTGSRDGSLDFSGSQVGHSNHAPTAIAPAAINPATKIGTTWP